MVPVDAVAEPVGDTVAEWGEGPCWDTGSGTLLWVDIPAGAIHRTDPHTGNTTTDRLPPPVSLAVPDHEGGLLVAAGHHLLTMDASGVVEQLYSLSLGGAMRFNDGKRDPIGRLWVGTMHTGKRSRQAALYRLDGETLTPVLGEVSISNGLDWSPDGATFYYIDTPTMRIDAFDYDLATGGLSRRRTFADLDEAGGRPDGLTVGPDGRIWVALIGGGALACYDPCGRLVAVARLSVSHPTSCAFGGADLYVTTARAPLSSVEESAEPLAGRLLRIPGAREW